MLLKWAVHLSVAGQQRKVDILTVLFALDEDAIAIAPKVVIRANPVARHGAGSGRA